mmetsp:Transcript_13392/g.25597  ORF Transcript_13392/g.25597 Transcript_13392/m.25597 type:complete len:287 (+) Transcript_13392:433-1293(+)
MTLPLVDEPVVDLCHVQAGTVAKLILVFLRRVWPENVLVPPVVQRNFGFLGQLAFLLSLHEIYFQLHYRPGKPLLEILDNGFLLLRGQSLVVVCSVVCLRGARLTAGGAGVLLGAVAALGDVLIRMNPWTSICNCARDGVILHQLEIGGFEQGASLLSLALQASALVSVVLQHLPVQRHELIQLRVRAAALHGVQGCLNVCRQFCGKPWIAQLVVALGVRLHHGDEAGMRPHVHERAHEVLRVEHHWLGGVGLVEMLAASVASSGGCNRRSHSSRNPPRAASCARG